MSDFWHLLWMVPMLFVAALVIPWLPWDDLGFPWLYDYTPRENFRSAYNHATGFIIGFLAHWWIVRKSAETAGHKV